MNDNNVDREHFAFLRSYWEQIKLLPSKKQKCEIFEAIMKVQFFENEINSISFSNQNQMILWEGLKPILKQSQKGYIDKMGLHNQNPMQGGIKAPLQHKDKDKEKDKEIKREGERNISIFYQLSDNEKLKEVEKYTNYLMDQEEYIKSPTAFKRKINLQLEKEDKYQLQDFEEWYLSKECEALKEKYVGTYINNNVISSIYPYFHTNGYDTSNKFIIWFNKDSNNSSTKCFSNKREIEEFIKEGIE